MIAEYWIASPQPQGYPALSNSQKVQMEDALYQFKGHYVRIVACERKDCQTLARDLIEVFKAAGWEQVPAAGKTINSRWISVSGPKRDPAVNAVVEQLNQVMPAPVIPPKRDDGGAAEVMIGEFALPGQEPRAEK